MIIKKLCVIVLLMKVASALEGLISVICPGLLISSEMTELPIPYVHIPAPY